MKLRLKGNSIRVRLDRQDIQRLADDGRVEEALRFGPGRAFAYAVEAGPAPRERPTADFDEGRLTIRLDRADVDSWIAGDRVGFTHEQAVEGSVVRILLEKDFACLERPAGEEADDRHAFPNPSASC
ncbi:DUF7009 family protein [Planctomyces sp. SH-PL62]|uniref:DUF7009 family protein n=1 Tax=Planctomyces sp. SH-PL62 TaxID=1636152 RepID=UPI00078ED872|nr:hypothetical protein [Planctomyces sp. SH-PL62]AMV36150.1 hypothetical protein VT85_01810 [Planctomyces sp. SH-PL62]